jgi:hypothetical protein
MPTPTPLRPNLDTYERERHFVNDLELGQCFSDPVTAAKLGGVTSALHGNGAHQSAALIRTVWAEKVKAERALAELRKSWWYRVFCWGRA